MNRDRILERMRCWGDREALVSDCRSVHYTDLLTEVDRWVGALEDAGIGPGRVVAFDGDFGGPTVALLLALLARGDIAVPLSSVAEGQRAESLEMAQAEFLISGHDSGGAIITRLGDRAGLPLLEALVRTGHPGLILYSSGSTGRTKAILHDFDRLLGKFERPRPPRRILSFLLLDHIGGLNTLFAGLGHGGTIITARDRRPGSICRAIARHRAEVLPTSPTFLNLLLLTEEHRRHDLASLQLITYGTEPMPTSTLTRLHHEFPGVRLQQTYGLSELGILQSKSRDDGSLWVKVGGEGYETKVVEGVLWIRARTAMLGYLNADGALDADGWFNTQDAVEQDGEWIRILGRTTDLINVGGQKVYPAEVEGVLLEIDNVLDATVHGEPNPLIGQCVVARINLREPETVADFKARMRRHCRGRLAPYMIPVKVEFTDDVQYNARGKRIRSRAASPSAPIPDPSP